MKQIEELAMILNQRGIKAEVRNIFKDGEEVEAIILGEESLKPVVYPAEMYPMTSEEMADVIIELMKEEHEIDTEILSDLAKLKNSLRLGIRPVRCDDVMTRPFLDLELYVYIKMENAAGNILKGNYEKLGIPEDDLFEIARLNSKKDISIVPMLEMMLKCAPEDEKEEIMTAMMFEEDYLWVGTNTASLRGASVMAFTDILDEFANEKNMDLLIIPSSVHEIIIGRYEDNMDINEMIRWTNNELVEKKDRLADHAYRYSRKSKLLTIE